MLLYMYRHIIYTTREVTTHTEIALMRDARIFRYSLKTRITEL